MKKTKLVQFFSQGSFEILLSWQPITFDLFIQLATQPYLAEKQNNRKKGAKRRQRCGIEQQNWILEVSKANLFS